MFWNLLLGVLQNVLFQRSGLDSGRMGCLVRSTRGQGCQVVLIGRESKAQVFLPKQSDLWHLMDQDFTGRDDRSFGRQRNQ